MPSAVAAAVLSRSDNTAVLAVLDAGRTPQRARTGRLDELPRRVGGGLRVRPGRS